MGILYGTRHLTLSLFINYPSQTNKHFSFFFFIFLFIFLFHFSNSFFHCVVFAFSKKETYQSFGSSLFFFSLCLSKMAASSKDSGYRGAFTSEISSVGQQLLEELESLQQEAAKHGDLYSDGSGDELDINFDDPEKRGLFLKKINNQQSKNQKIKKN